MANITVKVNPVTTSKVKQIAIGQVAAENFFWIELEKMLPKNVFRHIEINCHKGTSAESFDYALTILKKEVSK